MNKTIIGAYVSRDSVTLYTKTDSIFIKQGDPELKYVREVILPALRNKEQPVYDPNNTEQANVFAEYEKISKVTKFFKVLKKKVSELFHTEETALVPEQLGTINTQKLKEEASPCTEKDFDMREFVRPTPLSAERNKDASDVVPDSEYTVVAVVDDKPIPNAQHLVSQLAQSCKQGNSVGMDNLFKRLTAISSKRNHSVQDVLQFVEKHDLPISNNGDIIAYKLVNKYETTPELPIPTDKQVYCDWFTNKVPQWVGVKVVMDEEDVDLSRNESCSRGLHVARRGYMNNLYTTDAVLIALPPENILAVPHGSPSKVRTTGYIILDVLTAEEKRALANNSSAILDTDSMEKLAKALRNEYPEITHVVHVKNGDYKKPIITITPYEDEQVQATTSQASVDTLDEVTEAMGRDDHVLSEYVDMDTQDNASKEDVAPIKEPSALNGTTEPKTKPQRKPKQNNKRKSPTKTKPKPTSPRSDGSLSPREEIHKLLKENSNNLTPAIISRLKKLKKITKKSWKALGVADSVASRLN